MTTVVVACRVPNGIIIADGVVIQGPGRIVEDERRAAMAGQVRPSQLVYGYALTHNVDAEVWQDWLTDNAKSDLVRKKLIFADENMQKVRHLAYVNRGAQAFQSPFK